ncbi:ATP-dependent helicase C-terminal domain-containing protein, partial [Sphingomonas sp.]|uniref:ATP-dependent helicase C-terminal domain-containing protein n=1 Tax=Sphingomonas sp. TaxID=28214 RepID=UPI0035BC2437
GTAPPVSGRGEEVCVALAFPDRIARRRDAAGERWASVGGRGFRLDAAASLARAEWLAVAETQGSAAGARILSAAAIDAIAVESLFADRIETRRTLIFDPATGSIQPIRERRLGAIRLSSGPDANPDPDAVAAALVEGVRTHGVAVVPWPDAAQALRRRAAFAGIALDDETLLAHLDDWLPALVAGRRRLDAIPPGALVDALRTLAGWDAIRSVDRLAPPDFTTPAGSTHAIDYAAEAGPTVELRVQSLFGLSDHPTIGAGRIPLVLSLTSPAGRPIQTTRDLPGFWAGSWSAVAKEMRGRYPKHPWPDDPAAAPATLRTKKADARGAGSR